MNPEARQFGIPEATVEAIAERETRELARREQLYRGDRPPLPIEGRTVILVDDGLATGSTMRAAAAAVHQRKPQRIVVAVPVAARDTCAALRMEVDEVVCASTPEPFRAVGVWYRTSTRPATTKCASCWRRADPRNEAHGEPAGACAPPRYVACHRCAHRRRAPLCIDSLPKGCAVQERA
jgi:predicted phosphoribosyltransferase